MKLFNLMIVLLVVLLGSPVRPAAYGAVCQVFGDVVTFGRYTESATARAKKLVEEIVDARRNPNQRITALQDLGAIENNVARAEANDLLVPGMLQTVDQSTSPELFNAFMTYCIAQTAQTVFRLESYFLFSKRHRSALLRNLHVIAQADLVFMAVFASNDKTSNKLQIKLTSAINSGDFPRIVEEVGKLTHVVTSTKEIEPIAKAADVALRGLLAETRDKDRTHVRLLLQTFLEVCLQRTAELYSPQSVVGGIAELVRRSTDGVDMEEVKVFQASNQRLGELHHLLMDILTMQTSAEVVQRRLAEELQKTSDPVRRSRLTKYLKWASAEQAPMLVHMARTYMAILDHQERFPQ